MFRSWSLNNMCVLYYYMWIPENLKGMCDNVNQGNLTPTPIASITLME